MQRSSSGAVHLRSLARLADQYALCACACQQDSYWRRFQHSSSESPPAAGAPDEESQASPPGQHKWPRKRTRKELGSYTSHGEDFAEEFEQNSFVWPENLPLYCPAGQMDFFLKPSTDFPAMAELAKAVNANDVDRMAQIMGSSTPDLLTLVQAINPDNNSNEDILHWETHMVLHSGPVGDEHPMDKKVKCRVYLRDLQRQTGLTDAALRHIALVCGPRYDQSQGLLTLTCERYAHREANRRHIVRMIQQLVEAGEAYSLKHEPDQRPQQSSAASGSLA